MRYLDDLTKLLDGYLVKKAPALPPKAKEVLVKIAPWLSILSVILVIPGFFALLGAGSVYTVMTGLRFSFGYVLGLVFLAVTAVFRGLAIPGLFARTKNGWNMVFYSILANVVYSLSVLDIPGLIIGTAISLYIAFQVKEYYK